MAAQKGTPKGREHSLTIDPNPPSVGDVLTVTFTGPDGSKGIEVFLNGLLLVNGSSDSSTIAVSKSLAGQTPGSTIVIEYFNQDDSYEPVTLQLRP